MTPEELERNKRLKEQQQDRPQVPDKNDMMGIIGYLHKMSGRIPTETECLRFHMFLQTFQGKPTQKECEDFMRLLGVVRKPAPIIDADTVQREQITGHGYAHRFSLREGK